MTELERLARAVVAAWGDDSLDLAQALNDLADYLNRTGEMR